MATARGAQARFAVNPPAVRAMAERFFARRAPLAASMTSPAAPSRPAMHASTLITPFGTLAVTQSRSDGPPVLLVHGNSACKEIFARQFDSPALSSYRLIALDLPGHGASTDAPDPLAAYALDGFAAACASVLEQLATGPVRLLGWSLGGHIGLELLGRRPDLVSALMIVGTPPIPLDLSAMGAAFKPSPVMGLTGKEDFSDEDALLYAQHTSAVNGTVAPHLLAMCKRADGRFRRMMFESLAAGHALDEVAIVREGKAPLAVVNGSEDAFVNLDYIAGLPYGRLWEGKTQVLPGLGHAPFLQGPAAFNPIFARFLASTGAA
jgi:pimeloyl-ACP methyl ester carboxylesterase